MCEVSDPIPMAIFGIFPTCFAIWLGMVGFWWVGEWWGWFGLQDVGLVFGGGDMRVCGLVYILCIDKHTQKLIKSYT